MFKIIYENDKNKDVKIGYCTLYETMHDIVENCFKKNNLIQLDNGIKINFKDILVIEVK